MKKTALVLILFIGLGSLVFFFLQQKQPKGLISPLATNQKGVGPLSKYTFDNLAKQVYTGSQIKLGRIVKNENKFTSYLFFFESQGKKVSGLANVPKSSPPAAGFPVLVMLRGYVDDKIYRTGMGTQKPGEYFASEGFITLAPDFLGFGKSDDTYADILEDRFVRPVNVLDLIASIERGPSTALRTDSNKIGIWAHSNGGQIGISVLEISQKGYPTVLWAPVTKGFPESVTTYMSQLDDLGVKVKTRIDDFVKEYNPDEYSIIPYFADIKAPLQVQQGTGDEYIEVAWTDEFVSKMKSLDQLVTYYKYTGDNHNLSINWDTVVSRDLEFFRENLAL